MRRSTLYRGKWSWTTWRNSEPQYERLVVGSRADPCILSFKAEHMDADQPRHVQGGGCQGSAAKLESPGSRVRGGRVDQTDVGRFARQSLPRQASAVKAQATSVQFRANAVSPSDRSSSGVLSCARLTACRPVIRFAQRPVPGGNRSHTGIQHRRLPSGRSSHLFAPALSPAMVGRSPRYDHPAPNPRIVAINTVAAIADQLFHSAPRTKLRDHVWQLPRRRRPMSLTCSSPLCRVSA